MNRTLSFALLFSLSAFLPCVPAQAQEKQTVADSGVFVSEGTLDTYVGTYQISPGMEVRVWREGEQLMLQASGQGAWSLLAESETVFHVTELAAKITFGFNAAGRSNHLVLLMDGRETKAIRR